MLPVELRLLKDDSRSGLDGMDGDCWMFPVELRLLIDGCRSGLEGVNDGDCCMLPTVSEPCLLMDGCRSTLDGVDG